MKKIILIGLLAGLFACNQVEKPEQLLPREQMVNMLADVLIYQSMHSYNYNRDTLVIYHTPLQVLEKYGVDSLSFRANIDYYRKDLNEYSELFKEVQQHIQKEIDKVNELPGDEPKIPLRVNKMLINKDKDSLKVMNKESR